MDRYCKYECPDKGNDGCPLPSLREQAVVHGRVALRSVLEIGARFGRTEDDERFKPDWQLEEALDAEKEMKLSVVRCIDRHKYGEDAVVIQLRTER